MLFRTLGSTGFNVSVVGVGTWQFGGEWGVEFDQPKVDAIFDAARDVGINLIDTAECYGDHLSESFVGKAIARDRKEWIVATKFGHQFHGPFDRTEPRSPKDVLAQCERSLAALRTDYIDLYQYHSWGDSQFFADDVLAVLHTLRDEGKIRAIGNSVGSNTNLKQMEASKPRGIEAIQLIYNRLDREPERGAFHACAEQHLGVLARVPLASGFLSGKYRPGATFAAGDYRSKKDQADRDKRLREVEDIAKSEVPAGVPMSRWALAWCLKNPTVTAVIPGCKDADQVRENAAAIALVGDVVAPR